MRGVLQTRKEREREELVGKKGGKEKKMKDGIKGVYLWLICC